MIYYYDNDGRITRRVQAPDKEAEFGKLDTEAGYVFSNMMTDDAHSYVLAGELVDFPPKPAPDSEWDWSTLAWATSLDKIRDRLGEEINTEAAARDLAPIHYDNALFDADATARERIKGLADRITRGDGLTSPWLGWRDYDNGMHWQDADESAVLSALRGLTRAIEDRTQALLATAWASKAQLVELDLTALQAFDAQAGWPEETGKSL
ncbi:MAG: DUF4376 domain-containing protein [Betaproteobacteria bacterium]|nr:DUF4376 domain-containing protein [Betaproteobacteria bacterium]